MPLKQHDRQYDVVVFGASGYTGALTAEVIVTYLPTDLKWAVAGRNQSKLQSVVEKCESLDSDRRLPEIEIADVNDEEALAALVKKTYIFITTTGPYSVYGEKAFKACAENGTHYIDCTGEFPWVHNMIKKYGKTAQASGALMFPQTGIESAPPDLCTWAMAKCLRENLDAKAGKVVVSIHTLRSAPSGGTIASLLKVFENFTLGDLLAATKPYSASPLPREGKTRASQSFLARIFGSRHVPDLGTLTTSPAGTTDAFIVERTWGLLATTASRKDQSYGPNFTWEEYMRARNWFQGAFLHWFLVIGPAILLVSSFARSLVTKFVYEPGQGPEREVADREDIEYRGTAEPDSASNTGRKAFCRAQFQGGLYYLTAVLLAQASLTLLEEDVQLEGGIYTPACLGQPFIDRVDIAGLKIETKII